MYELIVFDLDNTLAKSKTVIDSEMSKLFTELLKNSKVAVISGGSFKQFEKELLYHLDSNSNFSNLHLFPTDGTAYYIWDKKEGKWVIIYQESLSSTNKIKIRDAISQALNELNFHTNHTYGDIVEDRESSLTFSALGQDAPLNEKEKWDLDGQKRQEIKKLLDKKIPEFEINIAGTTSIDITKKGLDKAYGIKMMMEYTKVPKEKIVFIGDSLFSGGNDNPVISTGIKTITVKSPEDTKRIIENIINNKTI